MDLSIQTKIDNWLNGNFDPATKAEIILLQKENPAELADAFYKNLEFGTGGLRGLMGVGTNRMNKYTVGMATQGYANYLKKCFAFTDEALAKVGGQVSVAIASIMGVVTIVVITISFGSAIPFALRASNK